MWRKAIAPTVAVLCILVGCRPPRLAADRPLDGCAPGDPPPSLIARGTADSTASRLLRGKVLESASRQPVTVPTFVSLRRDSVSRGARVLSDGTFRIEGLQSGRYALEVNGSLYLGLRDSVDIPWPGEFLEVALPRGPSDDLLCAFEQQLAKEPALSLARPAIARVEVPLASGAVLSHQLQARGDGSVLRLTSRIVNIGSKPAEFSKLCYPRASGVPLRVFHGIGPACHSSSATLAPGESLTVETGGYLRGVPGDYPFSVHPIEGANVDLKITLALVGVRRP